ncbi:MAG: hypothetical protein R3338_14090 [Thermoanaerobaculia bacterium]|nr:hypothetical protein [Thermoanaerobaculia bacterium]
MADETKLHQCPLCTLEFRDGWACHSSCPVSTGCGMIKCPRCNYEFVAESRIMNFFRGLVGGTSKEAREG